MEPYRLAGFRCPICPESPLREYQERLVCDECHGLFIANQDFISACADLCNADLELTFAEIQPATGMCPRCEGGLSSAHAVLAAVGIRVAVLRCERDGLWLDDRLLAAVFARIGRTATGSRGRYYAGQPAVGLDGLPIPTHAPATAGLAISQWRHRPRRRAQTATPINLYRDHRLACPTCADHELRFYGDRYACDGCGGTFVQSAALEAMVMDIAMTPWDMPPATGAPGPRACPVCSSAMVVEELERVTIDRCAEHGVWFDPDELTIALEHASGQFEPRGVRAWLGKLFG